MNKITLKARAKINLTLDVLGKRPDGYHEVEMVMQTIGLHDELMIEDAESGITVTTNNPGLPGGESNTAYRAAKMMIDSLQIDRGVKIHIIKGIPVSAGLAGGSTDAAAVIKGLNHLWNLNLSREDLVTRAAQIGSDVPFCIRGGTALARGRGELLAELPDIPEIWLVLAKPLLEVSTAEIYQNFDPRRVIERPNTGAMIKAVRDGNISGITENLANVLESVTLSRYPVVLQVKQAMEDSGVRRALMSGSGPTVFGLVDSQIKAKMTVTRLRERLPGMFAELSRTWPGE
ncbi:MAG: 4-(cytidine 5'-diphospho)-2-C-methyl-D-erythritol kinase [Eubacteriales bacterium]